ncbi:MAG: HupE/UreJ family protein [Pseudomonadales bacterium]|nr:HupE/UreJ family protein [Pseudomonadales bacterium]
MRQKVVKTGLVWILSTALLLLLDINIANANKIQLAYLHIQEQAPLDDNDIKHYQALWKQPANSSDAPLSLTFSEGVSISNKAAPLLLNGSKMQTFTLISDKGLTGKSITIVNLEKTNTEVMLQYTGADSDYAVRLTPSSPHYIFKATPSSWQTIASYTLFGIEHILEGYDHLLFVLCLLLIASSLKKLLWAITGFTLAHSITLVLSTLNIIQLPIVVVEAVIALSIVFLATEIVKNSRSSSKKDSLTYRYPVAVSSSFGLLHGFGFASVLLELGLPQQDQFLALAFFNVGVEIGQLLFIAVALLLIAAMKKIINLRKYQRFNAYLIGSIASMWLIERVLQF